MKKSVFILSAMLMAWSCSKEVSTSETETDGVRNSFAEFSANIAEDTKTVMSGNKVSWEETDRLLVFGDKGNNNSIGGTSHAAFVYGIKEGSLSTDGKSATFSAEDPLTNSASVLALYPYPETPYTYFKNSSLDGETQGEGIYVNGYNNGSASDVNGRGFRQYIPTRQPYVKDGVAPGLIPMVAFADVDESSAAPELKFYYGAGIVRLNLSSAGGEKVRSIRLNTTSSGHSAFCTGSFYFYEKAIRTDCETNYGTTGNSNTFSYAEVVCEEPVELGEEPTAFNFVVSGRKYTSFAFEIQFEDGTSYTLVKGNGTKVVKGHIYSLPAVDVKYFDRTTVLLVDGKETTLDKLSSANVTESIKVTAATDDKLIPTSTVALIANKVKSCSAPVSVDFSEVKLAPASSGKVEMPTVFAGNANLGEISLPANVTVLPAGCFKSCVNLKSVVFDEALEETGGTVFWDDKENVGVIDLPAKFKTYGSCGMAWCEAFKFSNGNDNGFYAEDGVMFCNGTLMQYPKFKSGSSYTVPDGTTAIYANAFYANPELTQIVFSKDVVSVSWSAFHGSRALNVIDLSAYGADAPAPSAFKSTSASANAGANVGRNAADKKIILPSSDKDHSAEEIIARYAAAGWDKLTDGKDEYGWSYGWSFWIDGKKVDRESQSSAISELSGKDAGWKF